jgi:quinol monooxygenase YgiN
MAVGITVQFEIRPGANAAFEEGFQKAAAAVKAQDAGCEMYDLFRSVDSPARYVMVERWTTPELLKAHMKSPTMAGMAALAPHFAAAPSLAKYDVA